MTKPNHRPVSVQPPNFMDALLYLVAGSAMIFISITFLLWLRF